MATHALTAEMHRRSLGAMHAGRRVMAVTAGLIGLGVVNIVSKQSITPTTSAIPGLPPTTPGRSFLRS